MLQYKNSVIQNIITFFSLNNISAEVACLLYCYIHIIYQIIKTFSNIFTNLSEKSLSTAENIHCCVYLLKSIIKSRNLNQKMINILHNKTITVFKYYFNAAEISFSKFLTQVKNSQLKNHIVNQITIRLILFLADMNSENNKEKSITIDFIETINAVFINKITDLKLFSMNSIKHIELIHQLTVSEMNIIMSQNSVFMSLNNKILIEAMIIEIILSEHTKNENIDQISIMLLTKFFKLNH